MMDEMPQELCFSHGSKPGCPMPSLLSGQLSKMGSYICSHIQQLCIFQFSHSACLITLLSNIVMKMLLK